MNTLKNLGYTNIQDVEYKFGEIDNHLSKNSILLMYGTDSNSGRAHMWICDGIKRYACKLRLYQTDNSIILLGGKHPWKFIREWQTEGQAFYFFNWGWGSPNDCGWFSAISDFKVKNHNFNKDLHFIRVSNPKI